ncbi:GNAT family N-acetyltransferase [Paenibacillus sp. LMG 31459]|uniref:GNAT family N-acetyltransferase n=1 Tax=Paenibacillus phytohabitans TaxID=2654978 RepID=A0ABX1YHX1_9BACL|nr:GNAT family N-acetyltransferase [Paenibacillus phytohabitans]NOU80620.1 GNAT family N-acetyltransferase [Paenibacillus phytohabitans]
MGVTFKTTYNKGAIEYCVSAKVSSIHELTQFTERDYSQYAIKNKRISVPVEILDHGESVYTVLNEFDAVYNHYSLNILDFNPHIGTRPNEEEIIVLPNLLRETADFLGAFFYYPRSQAIVMAQVARYITFLMRECSQRDPREFSKEGIDPSWYTLGDTLIVSIEKSDFSDAIWVTGFQTIEVLEDGTLKLWLAYVVPDYRKTGVYEALLAKAADWAKSKDCHKLSIATDTTDSNVMNYLLTSRGFKLDSVTFRN